MTTARDLCLDAISESGAIGVGQTPNAEDINATFTRLQRMVKLWQTKRWLVPALQRISFTADGSESYTIGLGGDINIPRPNDIKGGYVIQRNTGSTPISMQLRKIFSYEDYIRIAVKNLNSLPTRFFYDAQYTKAGLGHIYPWPIPSNQYELHFLLQTGLNFGTTISQGEITDGGSLYTDGNYENVELTGGSGTGATADITVTAGAVAIVTLKTGGKDYEIGDVLSADAAFIGGTGSDFEWTVQNVTADINTEIIMPDEYEEPLMYNLALRVCSYYQAEPIAETKALAKAGLNTIRQNNTQVPQLTMPCVPGLRRGIGFNIYNPDGY